MAPAAKRKKPGEEDQSAKPATKPRAKKQRTDPDPSTSIETPPPTPKPAAAPRGGKPNAAKAVRVNGNHVKANGTVQVVSDDAPAADHAAVADRSAEAPAVKPVPSNLRRKFVEDDEEDEPTTNGQQNGLVTANSGATQSRGVGSETQPHTPSQGLSENLAKDAAPVILPPAPEALGVPGQTAANGHRLSTTPTTQHAEPQTVRSTTERPPANMEPAKRKEKVKSKEREMRDKLYQYCIKSKPVGEIYSIEELKKADITQSDQDLLNMCQQLVTHFLFSAMTLNRGIVYKTRSYEVAKKLATVSENHILIYSLIENSGGSGAWLRPLESKSNLHTGVVRRCLKELLVLRVITEIKSADTSKKTYISADVKPDAKHIGGGFMDEGKFDEGMIDVLTYVAVQFLQEKGWHKQDIRVSDERDPATSSSTAKHKSKTPAPKSSKPTTKDQPAITIDDSTITPAPAPVSAPAPPKERKLYPSWVHQRHPLIPQHPNYYTRYPTTLDVMFHMNENGALKDVVLTLKDTEQLLAKMQFDGYVERMRDPSGELHMKEPRWRASKRVWKMDTRHEGNQHFGFIEPAEGMVLPGNGLSQVPCARCPVKARCKPGGVVSPEECKYLEDWLSF